MRGYLLASFALSLVATAAENAPTFNKDVAPVLQKRCQVCHRPGEAAPFSLLTYKDARPWAKAIQQAVVSRKMPPWHADPSVGHFKNDRTLSDAERDTLVAWVNAGAPEGNPKDAPKPLTFIEGWNIGKPDAVFTMPEPFFVPAKGSVDYQWIVLPTGFTEDKWLQAVEVRPGDRGVVHHVIAFFRKPGSKWLADAKPGIATPKAPNQSETGMADGTIGGYVPGLPQERLPEGRAVLLPAGADLVIQMHYTASGKDARDQTKVGLIFAKEPPKERSFGIGVGTNKFVIPPGDPNYVVESSLTLDSDVRVLSFTPHMHLRGKSFEYRAVFPDGTSETLLRVPKYDFNWQVTYELANERIFPKGTRIEAKAAFDNSPNNPFNPDPKVEVRFGDQTWDEMMVGFVGVALTPDQDIRKLIRPPQKKPEASGGQ